MEAAVSNRFERWVARFPLWTSAIAVLVGSAVLLGWALNLPVLEGVALVPGSPSMKANTALAFVLAGFSLLFLKAVRTNRWTRTLARVFPVLVALLGMLNLTEYLFGLNLGIDQMLFREPPGTFATVDPGRMAPATALSFSLLGLALLFPGRRTRLGLSSSEILNIPAILLAAQALIGYAYGALGLTGIGAYTPMAVHTSATFIVLELGIVVAYPNEGLAAIFLGNREGGYMARRLLPVFLAGILLTGWLALAGEGLGLYGSATTTTLVALALMVVASGAVFWNARSLSVLEERRERAERDRNLLFNHSLDMLCIADFDGYFRQLNPAWERVLGWTNEELMSKPYLDFVHPEDRKPTIDAAGGLAEGKTVITFENRYRCKDGSYRWISWNSYPLMEEELIFADARDITDHKQAEEIRSRLSAIVESSEDAIFSKTLDGIIVTWNRGAERMYGYTSEEAIGKNVSMLAPKDRIDEIPQLLQRVKAGEAVPHSETIRLRKDRTPIHVSVSMSPIRDASGRIAGVSTIARDITERKRAEEQIARQAKELARSNSELEQFAYVASHDLQEPLRMVASYTELIAKRYKGKLDAEADEFISYAVDGANRMRALINDLLVYSRVGTRGRESAPTSLQVVLDEALSNLQVAIRESGAEITHNAMPIVMADGSQLVLVFQNLIGNAIKFRRESPPRVHVAAQQKGDEWILSVRDNGIGIDPRYFHRLFTMFQRLHARNEYPGTGIGLAIVKKVVERHLGRVWVESEPGQGSTFYFTIPAKEV
ncbi:MAG TPA: PAS domain S-box protein [Thermoplasmata archaeon]|jgi:PAS domain S-box-containing protein